MSKSIYSSSVSRMDIREKVDRMDFGRLIFALILVLAAFIAYQGGLFILGLIICGGWALVYTYHHPLPALIVQIVVNARLFGFADLTNIVYFQLGSGLRIDIYDAILLALFGLALIKLYVSKEKPLFLGTLAAVGIMVLMSSVLCLILGTTSIKWILSNMRSMFSWSLYFSFVAFLDTPRRLDRYIKLLFIIVVGTVIVQGIETIQGQPLFPISNELPANYVSMIELSGGEKIAYIWNKDAGILFIGLFLALGTIFLGVSSRLSKVIAFLCLSGFVLALVRQWYAYILLGIMTLILLSKIEKKKILTMILMLVLGALLATSAINFFRHSSGSSVQKAFFERLQMLLTPQRQENFSVRLDKTKYLINEISESPWVGLGMTEKGLELRDSDVGFVNTITRFGIIGLSCIVFVIVSVLLKGYRIYGRLDLTREKGFVLGILGAWCGMILAYCFANDFFTTGGFMACFSMALLDRVYTFHKRGFLPR